MQQDHVQKKLNFDLLTPGSGCLLAKYLLWCCCICDSLKSDMQHDHILKKVEFWPIDPIPRVRGICGQNICYHVAAFVILFNLICNNTMFGKSFILTYWLHTQGRECLRAKYLLRCCCIHDSLQFDMQQDHVQKKLNFDLLTPRSGCLRAKYLLWCCCFCDSL